MPLRWGEESIVKFHWGVVVKVIEKTYFKKIAPDIVDWFIQNKLHEMKPIDLFSFFIEQVVPDMALEDIIYKSLENLINERENSLTPTIKQPLKGGKKSKKKSSRKRIKGKKKGKYTRKR